MGLIDVLNGMQNGPHGPRGSSSGGSSGGGMSPLTMAILGLLAYKAVKSFTSTPSTAPAGSPAPAPTSEPPNSNRAIHRPPAPSSGALRFAHQLHSQRTQPMTEAALFRRCRTALGFSLNEMARVPIIIGLPKLGQPKRFAIATAIVIAIIVYGSLYPFAFRPAVDGIEPALRALWESRAERWGRMISLANILLYMPLGFCAIRALGHRGGAAGRMLLITLLGAGPARAGR